ncbi:MAG: dTDP-4-dehydrorhamnose 3,5-epimerase family protein [Acidobacteriota bacterium]
MIDGVVIRDLEVHPDERGWLMEILRRDDPCFRGFGQVYATAVWPGVIKGWHYHRRQWDHFAVVSGTVKLVLFDRREDSATRGQVMEMYPGVHHPVLVAIPPEVAHGFKGVGTSEAIVINVPDQPYDPADPDEYRIDPTGEQIPYDWSRKDG